MLEGFQLRRELVASTEEEVWLARERETRRPVVVRLARSEGAMERILRAEESLRRIREHEPSGVPGIVGLVAAGPMDDGYALVLDHVEGASLSKVLYWTRFTPPRAVAAVLELCGAVAACHRAGVVVEDLHPDHILVGRDDRGRERYWIASFEQAPSPTTSAPELLRVEGSTEQTDVYALGLLLYRLLVGRFPFEGRDEVVIAAQIGAEPPALGQYAPRLRVPPGLEEVVLRCLAKDPSQRFDTVDDLVRALEPLAIVPQRDWVLATGAEATLVTENEEHHHEEEGRPSPLWLLVPLILLAVVGWLVMG
ncbi:MAG: protein kinase [Alphaproteobacteria bacterium]|nr:protein kinase [Alphaproteobacteria bacterium]